jgi:hypothetical protein
MSKIEELLLEQADNPRSRGVLLKLFQAFYSVQSEKERYKQSVYRWQQHGEEGSKTIAWADGYLTATANAIKDYLEARFKLYHATKDEIELVTARKNLAKLFDDAAGTTNQGLT